MERLISTSWAMNLGTQRWSLHPHHIHYNISKSNFSSFLFTLLISSFSFGRWWWWFTRELNFQCQATIFHIHLLLVAGIYWQRKDCTVNCFILIRWFMTWFFCGFETLNFILHLFHVYKWFALDSLEAIIIVEQS